MNEILTIGYDKGEMDFAVSLTIENLTYEQMNELRSMIVVAIGTAEDIWRRASMAKEMESVNSAPAEEQKDL